MKKVAVIVGHYGPGTGASYNDRDEWTLAMGDAEELYSQLKVERLVQPLLFYIDRREFRWRILGDMLKKLSSIDIKINWINETIPDLCLELHYNSAGDTRAAGHEVLSYDHSGFADSILRALDVLENPNRGVKTAPGLRLFRKIKEIPTVITESAFLFEDLIEQKEWRPMLVSALKHGIYQYLEIGGES